MEYKQRKYYNRSSLASAERGFVGEKQHKVLKLRFASYDREKKEGTSKFFTMFLTEENNERNRDTLHILGVSPVPAVVSFDNVDKLSGLGDNVVDLVAETNDAGYENVKYINKPKFDLKVFDMKAKSTPDADGSAWQTNPPPPF
tara:strand:- start:5155 stop:5586 length:432 start_codon:yes stop_codon:yes gene_type:complete